MYCNFMKCSYKDSYILVSWNTIKGTQDYQSRLNFESFEENALKSSNTEYLVMCVFREYSRSGMQMIRFLNNKKYYLCNQLKNNYGKFNTIKQCVNIQNKDDQDPKKNHFNHDLHPPEL